MEVVRVVMLTMEKTCEKNVFSDMVEWSSKNLWKLISADVQPRTKYLRKSLVFMWNSALPEKLNFFFKGVFCYYWQNFLFGRKTGH